MNRRGFMAALAGAMAWCGLGKPVKASRPNPDYASLYIAARQESDCIWLKMETYRGLMTRNECRRLEKS